MLPFEQAEEKHPGNQSHLQPGAGRRMKRVLHEEGPAPCARPGFCPCPVRLLPSLIFISSGGKIKKTTDFCRQPDILSGCRKNLCDSCAIEKEDFYEYHVSFL